VTGDRAASLCGRQPHMQGVMCKMKTILTIFLALLSISSICIGASIPRYVITSECITSIEVHETKYPVGWALIIELNESAAEEMLSFSKKYIGKKVRIVDGKEKNIIKNGVTMQSYLSSSFQVAGLSSQKEAINAKMSILGTSGKCGEKQK
jgi:hypothetical protein